MIDITKELIGFLLANSGIQELVGNSIFSERQPQDVAAPCVLLWTKTEEPWNHLQGHTGVDQASIQIDSYGRSRAEANQIAGTVRQSLTEFLYGRMGSAIVKECVSESGIIHGTDRPTDGSAEYRYISSQMFSLTYDFV